MTGSILVLGLGNPLLGDEGVGPRAVEALRSRVTFSPGSEIELLDGSTAGLGLVPRTSAAEKLLVLDLVRAGERPGTVLKLDLHGGRLARDLSSTSPHQTGLADILSASRLLGGPDDVVVLGIEPQTTELGIGLSEPVENALSKLIGEALHQLAEWGIEWEENEN